MKFKKNNITKYGDTLVIGGGIYLEEDSTGLVQISASGTGGSDHNLGDHGNTNLTQTDNYFVFWNNGAAEWQSKYPVVSLTGGVGVDVDASTGAVTATVDLSELSTSTSDGDGDYFVVVDIANAQYKLTKANINISGFNNDAGYTTNVGDITRVNITAGIGLTGTQDTTTGDHTQTLALAVDELSEKTGALVGTDRLVGTSGTTNFAETISGIPLSIFNNDAGWTANIGDITRVNITAGTGLTGTVDTTSGDHTQTLSVNQAASFTWTGTHSFGTNDVSLTDLAALILNQTVTTTQLDARGASNAKFTWSYDTIYNGWFWYFTDEPNNTDLSVIMYDSGVWNFQTGKLHVNGSPVLTGNIVASDVGGSTAGERTFASSSQYTFTGGLKLQNTLDMASADIWMSAGTHISMATNDSSTSGKVQAYSSSAAFLQLRSTTGDTVLSSKKDIYLIGDADAAGGIGKLIFQTGSTPVTRFSVNETGDIVSGTWTATSISTTYTDAKVTDVQAGTAIDVSATTGSVTVNVDLSELSTSVTDGDGDYFVVVDAANAQRKLTKANINLSGFNNDSGWTSNIGDITRVNITAGTGLSGTVDTTSGDHTQTLSVNQAASFTWTGTHSFGTNDVSLTDLAALILNQTVGTTQLDVRGASNAKFTLSYNSVPNGWEWFFTDEPNNTALSVIVYDSGVWNFQTGKLHINGETPLTSTAHTHLASQIGGSTDGERTFASSSKYTFSGALDVSGNLTMVTAHIIVPPQYAVRSAAASYAELVLEDANDDLWLSSKRDIYLLLDNDNASPTGDFYIQKGSTPSTIFAINQSGQVTTGVWQATSISTTYTDAKVTDVQAGTAIDVSATTGSVTVSVDLSELSTSTSDGDGDYFVVVDAANAQRKLTKANINLSGFNNDSGWTANTGDITRVNITAGTGLSGTVDTTSGDHTQTLSVNQAASFTWTGTHSFGTNDVSLTDLAALILNQTTTTTQLDVRGASNAKFTWSYNTTVNGWEWFFTDEPNNTALSVVVYDSGVWNFQTGKLHINGETPLTSTGHTHIASQIGGSTDGERTFASSSKYTFSGALDVSGNLTMVSAHVIVPPQYAVRSAAAAYAELILEDVNDDLWLSSKRDIYLLLDNDNASPTGDFYIQKGSTPSTIFAINQSGQVTTGSWTATSISTTYTDAKVTDVQAGTAIDVSATTGSVTVNVDLSELSTSTTDGDGDYFVVVDTVNAQRKLTKANINISGFNNDAGYGTGDITRVNIGVGTGLSGAQDTTTGDHTQTISLSLNSLSEKTGAVVGTDRLVGLSGTTHFAETISGIPLSIFNNDSGWTSNTGDITRVNITAGTGLSGTVDTTSGDHTQTLSVNQAASFTWTGTHSFGTNDVSLTDLAALILNQTTTTTQLDVRGASNAKFTWSYNTTVNGWEWFFTDEPNNTALSVVVYDSGVWNFQTGKLHINGETPLTSTGHTHTASQIGGSTDGERTFSSSSKYTFSGALDVSGNLTMVSAHIIVPPSYAIRSAAAGYAQLILEDASDDLYLSSKRDLYLILDNDNASPTGDFYIQKGSTPSTIFAINQSGQVTTGSWTATAVTVQYGGTGATSLTQYAVLLGNGTGTVATASPGTSGYVLTSNGPSANPTFQASASASLAGLSDTTISGTPSGKYLHHNGSVWIDQTLDMDDAGAGTLAVGRGGTGNAAFTANSVVYVAAGTTFTQLYNSTTTKKWLTQTGTGAAANAPTWDQPTAADVLAGTFPGSAYVFGSGNGVLSFAGAASIQFYANEMNTKSGTLYLANRDSTAVQIGGAGTLTQVDMVTGLLRLHGRTGDTTGRLELTYDGGTGFHALDAANSSWLYLYSGATGSGTYGQLALGQLWVDGYLTGSGSATRALNFLPYTNETYDLGGASNKWLSGWIGADIAGEGLFVGGVSAFPTGQDRGIVVARGAVTLPASNSAVVGTFATTGNASISVLGGTTGMASIYLGDTGDYDIGGIQYDNSANQMVLRVSNYNSAFLQGGSAGCSFVVGVDDTSYGALYLRGHVSGTTGGLMYLYTGAAYDTNVDYYWVRAQEDDFRIGTHNTGIGNSGRLMEYAYGDGTWFLWEPLHVDGGAWADVGYDSTAGGAVTIDWDTGNSFFYSLTSAPTFTFSNMDEGQTILVYCYANGAGRTITWPTVTWATIQDNVVANGYTYVYMFHRISGVTVGYLMSYDTISGGI